MKLYVVVDTSGDGRLVGVFDKAEKANKVVAIEPCYYRVFECGLNKIQTLAVKWARSDKQKLQLKRMQRVVCK